MKDFTMESRMFSFMLLLSSPLLFSVSSSHLHLQQFPPFHIQPPPLGHHLGDFYKPDIVSEIVGRGPQSDVQVLYNVNATLKTVSFGNELTPSEAKDKPIIFWFGDPNTLYTIMMIDPDAPSRKDPAIGPVLHFLVGNIPGHDVNKGHIIADYQGPQPPKDTGFHRYIFLLYHQLSKIDFKEPIIPSTQVEGRTNFPVRNFTQKYPLFGPVASNFFVTQNEDSKAVRVGDPSVAEEGEGSTQKESLDTGVESITEEEPMDIL